jgi:glycosyltransferase involved in cell wall biosynthesis
MRQVLIITSRLPYPPIGGDRLKNYNLIKILSRDYKVCLVSITNEKVDDKALIFLSKYTQSYKIFKKNKFDFLLSTSRTLVNLEPLQVNYYYFKDVQDYINSASQDMDILISTLIRTSKYFLKIEKPKIFDMADSIGQNYKKSFQNVKSIFWKIIYKVESNKLIQYEKETIRQYNKTLMFNKEEISFLNIPSKIKFIPHGVNEELLTYEKMVADYNKGVAFFGKMNYQANIDAVLWFVENVLESLNKDLVFYIVGASPTSDILKLKDKYENIVVTGFVVDPYKILKSCSCIVAPMKTGAGIQNKVLETMALGTINIISPLAAKPIGANNTDYIVLDTPVEIASKINDISENPKKYSFYKANSKEFIRKNFTWSIYGKVYMDTIKKAINDNKS